MNNTNEKSLIVIKKKNLITRMIDFFLNIFNKNKSVPQETYQNINQTNVNDDIRKNSSILMSDIERKFYDFRSGYIKEEDLTEDEKKELTKMFQERIKKEQEEIEYFRKKIIEIREKYLKDV